MYTQFSLHVEIWFVLQFLISYNISQEYDSFKISVKPFLFLI